MKTVHPLVKLRRAAGLPHARGMSAAEMRAKNPALAAKWATFIEANRPAIVREVARSL